MLNKEHSDKKRAPALDSSNVLSDVRVRKKVAIVDGMAELQSLDKPAAITTCADYSGHCTEKVLQKYFESGKLYVVFDRCDFTLSLKSATRLGRQGDQHPVYYHVTDSTRIAKVPMKRFPSRKNQDGIDGVSISQDDSKIRMHGKECYRGLGVLLSRNSL